MAQMEAWTRARGGTIALAHSAANLHHKVKVVLATEIATRPSANEAMGTDCLLEAANANCRHLLSAIDRALEWQLLGL